MFGTSQQYDLAYVSPSCGTYPELVFITHTRHRKELAERLFKITEHIESHARAYCGLSAKFDQSALDLPNGNMFGYGGCGYVTVNESYLWIHVRLRSGRRAAHAALTVFVLTTVFYAPFERPAPITNRWQQILVQTSAVHDIHGHSVIGFISGEVVSWLAAYAKSGKEESDANETSWSVEIHPEVVAAMQETWRSVAVGRLKKRSSDCGGVVTHNGRFILGCFGDACDLAIYPDQLSEWSPVGEAVQFSCHNLDTAPQQLTLLAGLAKLCELARESS